MTDTDQALMQALLSAVEECVRAPNCDRRAKLEDCIVDAAFDLFCHVRGARITWDDEGLETIEYGGQTS